MLRFNKTAVHPFQPTRHHAVFGRGFNIYTPIQVHLLPGQTVVVDFLLTITIPEGYRAEMKLKTSGKKLLLRSHPLSECPPTMIP
jgi:hypothetical protein